MSQGVRNNPRHGDRDARHLAAVADDGPDAAAAGGRRLPGPDDGPASPTELSGRSWWLAAKRAGLSISRLQLTDRAAALTYYGVLSLFPALLIMVSTLGLLGDSTADEVIGQVVAVAPPEVRTLVFDAMRDLSGSQAAGLAAVVGLLGAVWAASGYVGAFIRAANAIYQVPEGRPLWKTIPLQVGVTLLTGVMLAASVLIVVVSGPVARWVGELVGVGGGAVTVWAVVKWPILAVLVSLVVATLYRATPNARQGGLRWVSPGGLLAVVLWVVTSVAFSLYASTFGNYSKTYGAIAGVIVFLVWLWISNIVLLLGATFDAELERTRVASAGFDPTREPFLAMRDDRAVPAAPAFDDPDARAAGDPDPADAPAAADRGASADSDRSGPASG
ncbi:hypothetical protein GCM10010124_13620 [Pilimelia terevasa]|uniref:Uncharacterized protein n=1 Tax=Pilimelia terevasa TaxID=53372 RepID=A0A8J3BHG5_9ACTN|nr:YihY/virulence factor BrkB family protein [Pilimelia terevasa]GGK22407.1 hypothetical protein GCM10010124_13620 [Pilimelia terevasa]